MGATADVVVIGAGPGGELTRLAADPERDVGGADRKELIGDECATAVGLCSSWGAARATLRESRGYPVRTFANPTHRRAGCTSHRWCS